MEWLILILVIGFVSLAVLRVVVPEVLEAVERAQRRRAVAEASWLIHQRATAAFAQMLVTARELNDSDETDS